MHQLYVLTEANDGRKVGEFGIANALRDSNACDGEAGEEVGAKQTPSVSGKPLEHWDEISNPFEDPTQWVLFILQVAKGVIKEERFFEARFEFGQKPSRGGEVNCMHSVATGIHDSQ